MDVSDVHALKGEWLWPLKFSHDTELE